MRTWAATSSGSRPVSTKRYCHRHGAVLLGGRQQAVGGLDDHGGQARAAVHGNQLTRQDARVDPADFGEAQEAILDAVTIRPMASMWVDKQQPRAGFGAAAFAQAVQAAQRLTESSSTSGRQASAISTSRTGSS